MTLNKNNKLKKTNSIIFFLILFCSVLFNSVHAQYEVGINNLVMVSDKSVEFDVYAKSLYPLAINGYQCVVNCNTYSINGGSLTFSYLTGTSQFTNYPLYSIGVKTELNATKLCFASNKGSDTISTSAKKIGRFRIVNTNSFRYDSLKIIWNLNQK